MDLESQDPIFNANLGQDENLIWTKKLRCSHSTRESLYERITYNQQFWRRPAFLPSFGKSKNTYVSKDTIEMHLKVANLDDNRGRQSRRETTYVYGLKLWNVNRKRRGT